MPLPRSLLSALHLHHPLAQLCVSIRQLDHETVKSSQLHRLSISIPCSDVINPSSLAPFEQLRQVLMHNHNVRALSIDAHLDCNLRDAVMQEYRNYQSASLASYGSTRHSDPVQTLLNQNDKSVDEETFIPAINVQLPLTPTDQLPKLEELAIKARTYTFDKDHCLCLQQCIDWSRLKRLTLNCSNYGSFFETFTCELLRLEYLDVFVQTQRHPYRPCATRLDGFCNFMSSLHNLKALVVRYDDIDLSHNFWRLLVEAHGERLESLSLKRGRQPCADSVCRDGLSRFLSSFTALRALELVMPSSSFSPYVRCGLCSVPCSVGVSKHNALVVSLIAKTKLTSPHRVFRSFRHLNASPCPQGSLPMTNIHFTHATTPTPTTCFKTCGRHTQSSSQEAAT